MWSGRFRQPLDPEFERWQRSFPFDQRLLLQEIEASRAHAKALFDVTAGNNDWFFGDNGAVCGDDYLCVAKKGYDAPSGLGTPDGIGAF